MIVVGLAGPAGSGKSAVARQVARRAGVEWIDLDRLAWSTYEPGTSVFSDLVARFGAEIVDANGRIDRAALAERSFADPAGRRDLERLVHPALNDALRRRIEEERCAGCRILLVEGALLGSSPEVDGSLFDAILWFDVPPAVREERLRAEGRGHHAVRTDALAMPEGAERIAADAPLADVVKRVRRALAAFARTRPRP
ncbi:MAG: dephospho-CoA kinase [Candidatus Bipolaricaulis sp.]|nr:dephospho-CoA kinase [Candidatus Bipolaricaulis sp.]MDD5219429.1 dephospho-CoA kinase [Candidatus Bipolaricaulis sp.]MDD5646441.1 dephospho-CoA kinase [Candidatus Bipolaricaulis sp.]